MSAYPHPFYIVAPPYVRTSAGIRVLYKLADLINKAGASAYIYLRPHANHALASSPMDVAPFLTQKTLDYHFYNGLTPIVIYPETIRIKKFTPPIRVRYLLNYDELLFSNDSLLDDDYLLSYSQNIDNRIQVDRPRNILFLPVSDPYFYRPPENNSRRSGACYYAGKYKYKFKGKTFSITDGLPEITRDRPDSQTPEEIRALFQQSEYFYCYEDSALALEAMLCGCPVIFLPNPFFQEALGAKELGSLGYAWGTAPEQIEHARNTVEELRTHYFKLLALAQNDVLRFIEHSQAIASQTAYNTPFLNGVNIPVSALGKAMDYWRFAQDTISDRGLISTLRIAARRIATGRINFHQI